MEISSDKTPNRYLLYLYLYLYLSICLSVPFSRFKWIITYPLLVVVVVVIIQCDDGNTRNGDGCDSSCKREQCGNGFKQTLEECDDGNLDNGDRCDSDCFIEVCGNGKLQVCILDSIYVCIPSFSHLRAYSCSNVSVYIYEYIILEWRTMR